MSRLKKIFLITGVILGVLGLLAGVGLSMLSYSLCSTKVIQQYTSPSGKQLVQQKMKNCGATTDFVTSLTLRPIGGEILSIKGAHEDDLSVQWIDDSNLVVDYVGNPNVIYNYETKISGVKIQYKSGEEDLKIQCTYYDCEEQSRQLEIQRRKEWCNYSLENGAYCDQQPVGWETCDDGSRCHYDGPKQ